MKLSSTDKQQLFTSPAVAEKVFWDYRVSSYMYQGILLADWDAVVTQKGTYARDHLQSD